MEPVTDPSIVDVIQNVQIALDAGTLTSVCAAISTGLYLVISILRKVGGSWMSGNKVRLTTIFVGAGAALAGSIGAGLPWGQIIMLMGSGPFAIAIHEATKLVGISSKKPEDSTKV